MSLRSVLAVLVGALVTLALLPAAGSAAAAPASPWLQAQYNAAGSNANLAETTLTAQTIGSAVALRKIAPQGTDCYGYRARITGPLLSESHVYAVNGTNLVSYDVRTGAQVWSAPLPDYDRLAPIAVSHGLVIVAGNDCGSVSDPLGDVLAFRSADGSPAWTLPSRYNDAQIETSVSGQYLIVKTGEYPDARELSVYRVQDAHPVWTVSGVYDGDGQGIGEISDASARVVGGNVFLEAFNEFGYPRQQARELATGRVVWNGSLDEQTQRGDSDTAAGTTMYNDSFGSVGDVDPANGDRRYQVSSAVTTFAVDDARVYAACATDATIVCGYDRATGARLWIKGANSNVQGAISAGGLLYLSTGQVLNAGNGRLVRTLPGTPTAVGQGRVAVLRKSGGLVLYGLPGA